MFIIAKVKICGLRSTEDIVYVNSLEPDYVGFIFADSKRQVTPEVAKNLISKLKAGITPVGVFVNQSAKDVQAAADICSLGIIQLHGTESPDYCQQFTGPVWKSFQVKNNRSLKNIVDYHVAGYLLDAYDPEQAGGTGKVFDWDLAQTISCDYHTILAGGLTELNVQQAIKWVKPHVVDVSSGVESNNVKDYLKMKQFIKKVREINGFYKTS